MVFRSMKLGIWVLSLMVALGAAEMTPRSTDLPSVLKSLENELPSCAYNCFNAHATTSQSCSLVEDFITSDVASCLSHNCTTRQLLDSELLITNTCGTETRTQQSDVRAISWTLWAFATFFLSGRLLARSSYFGGMSLGYDDWAIVVSWVVLTGVTIGAELMVIFGLGTDMWTLDDQHITITLILFYVAEFAYVIESTITKVSILLLYLRIFPDKLFRKQVYVLMGIMGLFCVAFVVTLLTYCVPFDYTWMRWDNQNTGTCINMNAQTYVCAALNIVLDLIIFFIPIPQLAKLDLSFKKKAGIILTFCVGLFVTICSMIRLRALVGWTESTNQTWDFAKLAVWSLVELDVGVICACMPGMAGLFRRLKKRGTDYIRSKSSFGASGNASQILGGSKAGGPTITKTTIVTIKHTRGDHDHGSRGSESELELVDRSKGASYYQYGREMV